MRPSPARHAKRLLTATHHTSNLEHHDRRRDEFARAEAQDSPAKTAMDQPETRKVLVVGGSTLAVSIPRPWARAMALVPGGQVTLRARLDGTILVVPMRPEIAREIHVNLEADALDSDALLRRLIALYMAGVHTIDVRGAGALNRGETQDVLAAACQGCPGLQIVDEAADYVRLEDLTHVRDLDPRNGLRVMHLNVKRLLRGAAALLRQDSLAWRPEQCESELDRTRMLLFKQHYRMLRHVAFDQESGVSPLDGVHFLFATQYLERVGDYAMRMIDDIESMDEDGRQALADELIESAIDAASQLVTNAVRAFDALDADEADATIRDATTFWRNLPENYASPALLNPQSARRAYRIMDSLDRMARYAKSLAETAIDRATTTQEGSAVPEV